MMGLSWYLVVVREKEKREEGKGREQREIGEQTLTPPSPSLSPPSASSSYLGGSGIGGLHSTPYPLAISERYASTSSSDGVATTSFLVIYVLFRVSKLSK